MKGVIMANYEWNEESFGDDLPKNWELIVGCANYAIRKYAETHEEEEVENFAHCTLWEDVCDLMDQESQASYKLDCFMLCGPTFEDFKTAYLDYHGSDFSEYAPEDAESEYVECCRTGFITHHGSIAAIWYDGI